ncbi:MAG: hypothetical protein LBE91_10910 [Tannerella sp.]|jgi:ABC-type multidrug transport system fused ATPase/permease subunit|nr:hypothetical protein [Tannerella sp.]
MLYFKDKISFLQRELADKLRSKKLYEVWRGISFLLLLAGIYFVIYYFSALTVIFALVTGFLFSYAVYYSHQNKLKISAIRAQMDVFQSELDCLEKRKYPKSNGSEFTDYQHNYSYDLDIFGEQSLFHLLNRCSSTAGKKRLAQELISPKMDFGEIYERQTAVKELSMEKNDFVFGALAQISLRKISDNNAAANIDEWLQKPARLSISKPAWWTLKVIPWANICLLLATIIFPLLFPVLLLFIFAQWLLLHLKYGKPVSQIKNELNGIFKEIEVFNGYAETLKPENFTSGKMVSIKNNILKYSKLLKQLSVILSFFDMGDSMIGILFNILLLNHIKRAVNLERWKQKYQNDLPEAIRNIAELESLLSISVFAFEHPAFVYPQFENGDACWMEAKSLGHPLISENKNIKNDFRLQSGEIKIITGANMAGKSTFLRTLGINLLLAYVGAPVCATRFQCSKMQLFTSMRMLDNLENGISYFYAEALRFKQLLSLITSGENVLFLIDELFRGTNSDDRLKSSEAFIRNLTTYSNTAGLIASHDLKITELEQEFPAKIHNYCFECTNADDVIHFDYMLREGVTRTHNAYLLLRKLKVI